MENRQVKQLNNEDYKGFLLIRQTYKVKCANCGFRGEANLGKEPILTDEADGADWCPLCHALALVADHGEENG